MKAPETKIAVTLFNLRAHCKTVEDLDRTLQRVKDIGYRAVQISGIGPIEPQAVREMLDKHDLYPCATHEGWPALTQGFDQVVEKMKALGCDFTALGKPPDEYFSAEGVRKLAAEMDDIGARFRQEGIVFGYHNHAVEFESFTGKTFLQEIYDNTKPENLSAELDTYWIQHGGGDPVEWIRGLKGRQHVLHYKDYTVWQGKPHFCEVGEGNLNWPEIIKASEESGARWYVVEQDAPCWDRDIFEAIKISYENLKKLGVE